MKLNLLIATILIFFQHPILADIVTDGTVGPAAQSINAIDGQLTIGQELGSLKGGNLFHSFQQFDIEKNETAIFTGDDMIQNVISRVTGGNPSLIDGILRSEVGSADFYFINPAGVVFGENAQVDVPASFHVSTAGELFFADGSSFSALSPEASTLTVAKPDAFGFTSGQTGSMQIIDGKLILNPETDVSFSANKLVIQEAEITGAPPILASDSDKGLRLNLSAVDSATAQKIPITDLSTASTGGELSIENSIITVSGNGSGRLAIRAGTMSANNSRLSANNTGASNMSADDGVNVRADLLRLDNTSLRSNVMGTGQGGSTFVFVNKMLLLLNEGNITSLSLGGGNSGNVAVDAERLIIHGQKTGIGSDAAANSLGDTGDVAVSVKKIIQVLNGGRISSLHLGSKGNSGKVDVTAGRLIIDGFGEETGIGSDVFDIVNRSGETGNVTVSVNELIKVLNKGRISAVNFSEGNGGDVTVKAGQLIIDGQGEINTKIKSNTGISSLASGETTTSNAGTVDIFAENTIKVLNGGQINTSAVDGEGGDINLKGGKWIQLKNATIKTSVLNSSSEKAGKIFIEVPVLILDTGTISANSNQAQREIGGIDLSKTLLIVLSEDSLDFKINPNSINAINDNVSPDVTIVSKSIAGTLAGVITPSLDIERFNQDPCAHGRENSLKSLGHGGAPAFQHGENYLLINRFDESEPEPNDRDLLETTSSINVDHKNAATECAKLKRTSLN